MAAEIPATEAAAQQMQGELAEAEAKLEGLLEGIKGEVEGHHQALAKVGSSQWAGRWCTSPVTQSASWRPGQQLHRMAVP